MKIDKYNGNTHSFISSYSGFIGIMPWTHKASDKESNFLYTLYKRGNIDHMTMAIYVSDDGENSSIKFGSYDKIGVKPDSELYWVRTESKESWDLNSNLIQIGEEKVSESSKIRFEP